MLKRFSAYVVLVGLIALYTGYFSAYTIHRHNSLNSYMADLSLIDQPMWNTAIGPGDFMELTWGERQQPRLAEHVEPILVPLSLLFWLWDDVRVLLIAQSFALALGAVPVYCLARHVFADSDNAPFLYIPVIIYLLSPHLQAANIADFHADPFAVAPLLWAFYCAVRQRWGWMWVAASLVMLTKEPLPTLTAMLGLWLLFRPDRFLKPIRSRLNELKHGLALIIVSAAWFLIATFGIVAPLAETHFGTDGPIYLANRYTSLADVGAMLSDPARWAYIFGLLASVGFLSLMAPELLLLGLPILVANFFSNFAGQYSGEQHYSAPLVASLMIASVYGTRRLVNWLVPKSTDECHSPIQHQADRVGTSTTRPDAWRERWQVILITVLLWQLSWAVGYHILHGWTPLSLRTEHYEIRPAAELLPTLLPQVPADAVVSASPAIHPHLAHRRVIYQFPTVQEADYLLVDVTDLRNMHPNDTRSQLLQRLDQDWQWRFAKHGLLFAQRGSASAEPLPNTFYDFARVATLPDFTPRSTALRTQSYPTQVAFGETGSLRLLGYILHDDVDDGVTLRLYWRTTEPIPPETQVWPLLYDEWGNLLIDPTLVPMVATVWYPPEQWRVGEFVVTETLPHMLPDRFGVGVAVGPADSFADPSRHWPAQRVVNDAPQRRSWVELGQFSRRGPFVLPAEIAPPRKPHTANFGNQLRLLDYATQPEDDQLTMRLTWQATQPLNSDYTVFVHVIDQTGQRVAQDDRYPFWLFVQPTRHWSVGESVISQHIVALPAEAQIGEIQLGVYDSTTFERLPLPDGATLIVLPME